MTTGNSRSITSNQMGVHDDLAAVVNKHLTTEFKKPIAQHSFQAFKQVAQQVTKFLTESPHGQIILDSCCGVGESTYHLAVANPDKLVIGIDKSEHRIDKFQHHHATRIENFVVLRGDLNDLWRLIAEQDWPIAEHFILYPNPWPKAKHLGRRWHGTPVFSYLPKLSKHLTVRSNWAIYIEEFVIALQLAGYTSTTELYQSEQAMTPFERKYWASGQQSWQLQADFSGS